MLPRLMLESKFPFINRIDYPIFTPIDFAKANRSTPPTASSYLLEWVTPTTPIIYSGRKSI